MGPGTTDGRIWRDVLVKEQLRRVLRPLGVALLSSLPLAGLAQQPAVRLSGPITGAPVTAVAESRSPLAVMGEDAGTVPASMALKGLTLVFSRSAAQEADLRALLAAQQDPSSPQYHQWLTPDSFGARFGVADADLAQVKSWLQSQGSSVDSVNRSHNALTFSGTAGTVGAAFGTELHRYKLGTETHFAPATELSVPAALAPLVTAVLHTSDIRPKPSLRLTHARAVAPDYTSSQTQAHYLTPKDIATMYNVQAEYSAGYTGVGQSIAVVGQSYVLTSDVTAFQAAAGLATNAPTLVLVPSTGVSGISSGDEGESDIDLEYAGGLAPGANVYLVYVGNNANADVFEALNYAITENIAPVVSISYGGCEPLSSASSLNAYSATYMQAAAQGQSIIASAGDDGSEACYGYPGESTAVQEQLAVSFPASSPYVTAVGGTQMSAGTTAAGASTYWATASGTDLSSSLLSYVPEVTWNEDSTNDGIVAGGGGASVVFARPTYQAGVAGIPTGATRLLPDVSLLSAVNTPGFLYCSSDLQDLQAEDLTSSCVTGFRDASDKYLLIAGGTSFAAPVMAGMTALLNQIKHSTGQGLLNTQLYALAGNTATYASAFHDITSGTIACTIASATYCSTAGASGYAAGTGYDEATGLGSINFANLVSAWPSTSATALPNSVTTLAPATAAPAAGAADVITINVTSTSTSTVTPTGTVAVSVDGGTATTVALVNGSATYSYTASTAGGTYVIKAVYSGDSGHAVSQGTTTVNITSGTVATGSFSLAAANLTVATGAVEPTTVTVTPSGGYTGSVVWTLSTGSAGTNVCYSIDALPVLATQVATQGTLYIGVGTAVCGSVTNSPYLRPITVAAQKASYTTPPTKPWKSKPIAFAFAGLLITGFAARRKSRRLPMLLSLAMLTAVGLGLSGCGGSGTGQTTTTPPVATATTYTLTLTGRDSVTSSITSSTTLTLTTQ